jgi:hypothetical protein
MMAGQEGNNFTKLWTSRANLNLMILKLAIISMNKSREKSDAQT